MARSSECTDQYAQKVLDTADIVREGIDRQLRIAHSRVGPAESRSQRCREHRASREGPSYQGYVSPPWITERASPSE